jgi:serine/threonine protein phosphatase 1
MGKVFCSSDWHGCGILANKVLDYLKEDDVLYFLGDAIDRGDDGLEILIRLLDDPRVKFIKGNHEDMMEKALPHIIQQLYEYNDIFTYEDEFLELKLNGGSTIINQFFDWSIKNLEDLYKKLINLPLILSYVNKKEQVIIMEHSGYTPPLLKNNHDPLWDRSHFNESWRDEQNVYIIHGHTPVQYMKFMYGYKNMPKMTEKDFEYKHLFFRQEDDELNKIYRPEVLFYCDNHKIDIDMCTVASNRIALLDLDTFEPIYFNKEN